MTMTIGALLRSLAGHDPGLVDVRILGAAEPPPAPGTSPIFSAAWIPARSGFASVGRVAHGHQRGVQAARKSTRLSSRRPPIAYDARAAFVEKHTRDECLSQLRLRHQPTVESTLAGTTLQACLWPSPSLSVNAAAEYHAVSDDAMTDLALGALFECQAPEHAHFASRQWRACRSPWSNVAPSIQGKSAVLGTTLTQRRAPSQP